MGEAHLRKDENADRTSVDPGQSVNVEAPAAEAPILPSARLAPQSALILQRSAGNAAVTRLVQEGAFCGGEDGLDAGQRMFVGQAAASGDSTGDVGVGESDQARARGEARQVPYGRQAPYAAVAIPPVLARQGPAPPPPHTAPGASAKTKGGLTKTDFTCPPFTLNIKGGPQLQAKVAGDVVNITAPEVEARANVTWNPPAAGAPAGPKEVYTGFIQTVLSSERAFYWTHDGTPTGKVGREKRDATLPNTRDSRHFEEKTAKGDPIPGYGFAPFYQEPRLLKPGEKGDVVYSDQPNQKNLPLKVKVKEKGPAGNDVEAEYTLAKASGRDHYRLSVGVSELGDPGSAIHLAATEWSVPWDIDLPQGTGTGKPVTPGTYAGKLEDIKPGEGSAQLDTAFFSWPRSEAEADALPVSSLVKGIPFAERWDVNAWMYMSRALRKKNPTCTITANLKKTPSAFSDTLKVTIKGPREASKSETEWGTGAQQFQFQMLELMDPQELKTGLELQVSISRDGGAANTTPWRWPFNDWTQQIPFYWDPSETAAGELDEETRKKKGKKDISTEITLTARGFG
jgi:hypothetical protein